MRRTLLGLVAFAALATALFSGTAANARTDDVPMTEPQAGEIYHRQVCRENTVNDRLNAALPIRKDGYWYTSDLKGKVLVKVKKAAWNYSDTSFSIASRLLNPPAAWPDEVADRVDRQANLQLTQSEVLKNLGYTQTGREFARIWNKRFQPLWSPMSKNSRQIRAHLDVPLGC